VLGLVREDARIFDSFNKYFELSKATRPNVPVILWCPEEETYNQAVPKALEWGIPISKEKNLSLQNIIKPIVIPDDSPSVPKKTTPYWVPILFTVLIALLVFQKVSSNSLIEQMEQSHKLKIHGIEDTNIKLQSTNQLLSSELLTLKNERLLYEKSTHSLVKDNITCHLILTTTENKLKDKSEKLAFATEKIDNLNVDAENTINIINELKADHQTKITLCDMYRATEKNQHNSKVTTLESKLFNATQQLEKATKNDTSQKNDVGSKDPELRTCYHQIESQRNEIEQQELRLRRCEAQLKK